MPPLPQATKQHNACPNGQRVSFGDLIVTSVVHFCKRQLVALIGETACADSGMLTNLNRHLIAVAVGLPNIGTKVMVVDG